MWPSGYEENLRYYRAAGLTPIFQGQYDKFDTMSIDSSGNLPKAMKSKEGHVAFLVFMSLDKAFPFIHYQFLKSQSEQRSAIRRAVAFLRSTPGFREGGLEIYSMVMDKHAVLVKDQGQKCFSDLLIHPNFKTRL